MGPSPHRGGRPHAADHTLAHPANGRGRWRLTCNPAGSCRPGTASLNPHHRLSGSPPADVQSLAPVSNSRRATARGGASQGGGVSHPRVGRRPTTMRRHGNRTSLATDGPPSGPPRARSRLRASGSLDHIGLGANRPGTVTPYAQGVAGASGGLRGVRARAGRAAGAGSGAAAERAYGDNASVPARPRFGTALNSPGRHGGVPPHRSEQPWARQSWARQ
jgi:hypothetical protein